MKINLVMMLILLLSIPSISFSQDREENVFYDKCSICHSTKIIFEKTGLSKKQWKDIIKRMKRYGLKINRQEQRDVIYYLTKLKSKNKGK